MRDRYWKAGHLNYLFITAHKSDLFRPPMNFEVIEFMRLNIASNLRKFWLYWITLKNKEDIKNEKAFFDWIKYLNINDLLLSRKRNIATKYICLGLGIQFVYARVSNLKQVL